MEETVPKKMSSGLKWTLVIVGAVTLIVVISEANSGSSGSNVPPSDQSTAITAATETAPVQSGPTSSFSDGTYIVNTDIQPGTYRSTGGPYCYYQRLSGFGGTTADIIADQNPDGPTIVTILASDKGFTTGGCGTWTKIATPASHASASAHPTLYQLPNGALVDASGNVVLTAQQVQAFEDAGQNISQIEASAQQIENSTSTIQEVYQNSQNQ